ncbi:hypothetical protein HanIR_Chr17g0867781 [Helianthus annuus]|nr:hypothetical protein HanIR_Chr17g0867781 [Helianthus annuus]
MFSLDSCTSQATSNIESDIPFHTRPPVLVTKVLVHFISTEMNRVSGLVGFVHYNLSQIGPLRDPDSVQIIENPICFAYKLSSIMVDPLLLQSAFVKASMLGFTDESFEVVLGLGIANTKQITPSAECVGNNICLAWVITNLTVIIVKKFYPSALTHVKFFLIKDVL